MNITNKDSYFNKIMRAVVVNTNVNDDPEHKGRTQIYIPSLQAVFSTEYTQYVNSSNKSSDSQRSRYPWAYSTVQNLSEGNVVFVGNIENDSANYIILGIDYSSNVGIGGGIEGWNLILNGTDIISLAMPIIMRNEVSLNPNDYPDNISDDKYGKITPNDVDGWSIGLIQWHNTNAYDLLYEIAKADNNWQRHWNGIRDDIVTDLKASLQAGNTTSQHSKYAKECTENSPRYNGTRNMLLSDIGKKTQINVAENRVREHINDLQQNWSCNNPAIAIYTADILNQYGFYGAPNTKAAAGRYSSTDKTPMDQFEDFINWCKVEWGYWDRTINTEKGQDEYWQRRKRTYEYIIELFRQGKLNNNVDLTSIGNGQTQVKGFVPRTTQPSQTDYWYREDIGNCGYSMWVYRDGKQGNCTFYAWARASEILGKKYDGAAGDGVDYGDEDGIYKTGSTPRQGAIITWYRNGGGAGHVAIVENVSADGQTIWTSESGYKSFLFDYRERHNDGNWGASSYYTFRNFKYLI